MHAIGYLEKDFHWVRGSNPPQPWIFDAMLCIIYLHMFDKITNFLYFFIRQSHLSGRTWFCKLNCLTTLKERIVTLKLSVPTGLKVLTEQIVLTGQMVPAECYCHNMMSTQYDKQFNKVKASLAEQCCQ